MTDEVDHAARLEAFARETSVRLAQAAASRLSTPSARDQVDCVDCGDEIEPERRVAAPGARRCLFCQEARERHWPLRGCGR